MSELPFHLFLPLIAALLFVSGLIFVKHLTLQQVNPWTFSFLANIWAGILFSVFWFLGGEGQPWSMLWQPAIIAVLYMSGLVFTFCAIENGDVSIATPVFGLKVLMVALLVTLVVGQTLPTLVWGAAGLAVFGIGMIQWTSSGHPRRIVFTILFALLAACSFATFDVLVQKWSPAWGTGRFLPTVYWIVAILSLIFLPVIQVDKLKDPQLRLPLFFGSLLIACQAIFIVFTLSYFGDATRVNVVYATRGLWGVIFAWAVARKWGGSEADVPARQMIIRLCGAALLTGAVILALLAGQGDVRPANESTSGEQRVSTLR